ncbi:hypothetical protein AK812_SmicGene23381 [Symbiodinium microadriaticum]|uniref:Uncharacterized protein n=1 Tax=Symbiodinium microadriaticum TaxID=2951 RepID=A0A1Q9DHC9_SYMMI|nr:hypothetical protein AK812_SmicGene23381 [Symbiodinium microadriaticum]
MTVSLGPGTAEVLRAKSPFLRSLARVLPQRVHEFTPQGICITAHGLALMQHSSYWPYHARGTKKQKAGADQNR